MGAIRQLANLHWRDYVIDGEPSSGAHNVSKVGVRSLFALLESLIDVTAISATTEEQPASPAVGDLYILPPNPTGAAWTDFSEGNFAVFLESGWLQVVPREGTIAWVQDEQVHRYREGVNWVDWIEGAQGRGVINVRAATTANITLSGEQTIDGVSLDAGDLVLVKNQTTPAQNGVYVVAEGAWQRAASMNAWAEARGAIVTVEDGSTQEDTAWQATGNAGGTLDTTDIPFVQVSAGTIDAAHWGYLAAATGFAGPLLAAPDLADFVSGLGGAEAVRAALGVYSASETDAEISDLHSAVTTEIGTAISTLHSTVSGEIDAAVGALESAVTSALAGKQAASANLTEWAGVDPSTVGKEWVALADKAAMRAYLDLEAGVDFYSISGADAQFLPKAGRSRHLFDTVSDNAIRTAIENFSATASVSLAIQAACNDADDRGETIEFAVGKYPLDETISTSNVTLRGAELIDGGADYGNGGSVLSVTSTENTPLKLTGSGFTLAQFNIDYPNQGDGELIEYPPFLTNATTSTTVGATRLRDLNVYGAWTFSEFGGKETNNKAGLHEHINCRMSVLDTYFKRAHCPDIESHDHCKYGLNVQGDDMLHFGTGGAAGIHNIASMTRSGDIITVETATPHNLTDDSNPSIRLMDQADFNIENIQRITVTADDTFTFDRTEQKHLSGTITSTTGTGAGKLHNLLMRDKARDAIWNHSWGNGDGTTLSTISNDGLIVSNTGFYGGGIVYYVEGAGDDDNGGFLHIVSHMGGAIDAWRQLLKVEPGGCVGTFVVSGSTGFQERVGDAYAFDWYIDIDSPAAAAHGPVCDVQFLDFDFGFMRGALARATGPNVRSVTIRGACDTMLHNATDGDLWAVEIDSPDTIWDIDLRRAAPSRLSTGLRGLVNITANATNAVVRIRNNCKGWDHLIQNNSPSADVVFSGVAKGMLGAPVIGAYAARVKFAAESFIEGWPSLSYRLNSGNVLVGGCCRIVQSGTSATNATFVKNDDATYIRDQLILLSDGNDVVNWAHETTVVPDGARAVDKFTVVTANKKFGGLIPVEVRDARRLINGQAVAQLVARKGGSNATLGKIRAAIVSWQGAADAITRDCVSAWNAAGANPTLATNWSYETTPQDLPLTTSFVRFDENHGLTGAIDTPSTKQFGLFWWCDDDNATAGDVLYIGLYSIEKGAYASDFQHRPLAQELVLAQRYLALAGVGWTGVCLDATSVIIGGRFPVRMRVPPSVRTLNQEPQIAELGVTIRTASGGTMPNPGSVTETGVSGMRINGFSGLTATHIAQGAVDFVSYSAQL